jgi:hypothetical protein
VTPCAVCTVYMEMRSAGFLVEPQNQGRRFFSGLPQNHWDGFFQLGLKTSGDGFSWFDLKTGGFRFQGLGLKTGSSGLVIWSSKSLCRFFSLGLKTKQATICQLSHKTDGRMIRRGARVEI